MSCYSTQQYNQHNKSLVELLHTRRRQQKLARRRRSGWILAFWTPSCIVTNAFSWIHKAILCRRSLFALTPCVYVHGGVSASRTYVSGGTHVRSRAHFGVSPIGQMRFAAKGCVWGKPGKRLIKAERENDTRIYYGQNPDTKPGRL